MITDSEFISFFTAGNNFNERNEQIDTKSNQWFGATVSSAGIDGPLVVSNDLQTISNAS